MRIEYSGGGDAATEQAWWDLDDADAPGGGWTVYDPNSRLNSAPAAIAGYPGEYGFSIKSGWGSSGEGDLSGAAAGITIYRTPRDQQGNELSGADGWVSRLSLWTNSIPNSTANALVIGAGSIGGNPATSTTKIGRGHGLLLSTTQYIAHLTGLSNAGVWALGSTSYGRGRLLETYITHQGRTASFGIVAGTLTDGQRGHLADTLYASQTAGNFGINATIKEAIFIAANAAGSGTRELRLNVRCGAVPEGCVAPVRWPSATLPERNVWILGDSQWYGSTATVPWTFKAVERFLSRAWGAAIHNFRFVGTSANLSVAQAQYLATGTLDFDPSSGKQLTTIQTNTAANIAALVASGDQPDIVYLCAGANDAANGRSSAQILADYTSIATAIKAQWPSCKVYAVAGQSIRAGQAGADEWATVTASILASPPSGCDGPTLDWNTWKRGVNTPSGTLAFFESSTDYHPKNPATPTAINGWDTFSMDPAGADYSQNGNAAWAYAFVQHLVATARGASTQTAVRATLPPILTGEVRPYTE